ASSFMPTPACTRTCSTLALGTSPSRARATTPPSLPTTWRNSPPSSEPMSPKLPPWRSIRLRLWRRELGLDCEEPGHREGEKRSVLLRSAGSKLQTLSVESINLLSKYRRAGLLNTLVSLPRIARPNLRSLQASERSSAHYSRDERAAHFRERFFRPCCKE